MRRTLAVFAVAALPCVAFAAGTEDAPPTPTETTTKCTEGTVWDADSKSCVAPEDARLDDDTRFRAAREFAYAGQAGAALRALAAMREGDTDRVLTYTGFANRKAGRVEDGMQAYDRALAQNPDNLLARSYMGQGLVEQGEMELAAVQLDEIRARGGAGSWAERALAQALKTGVTYSY